MGFIENPKRTNISLLNTILRLIFFIIRRVLYIYITFYIKKKEKSVDIFLIKKKTTKRLDTSVCLIKRDKMKSVRKLFFQNKATPLAYDNGEMVTTFFGYRR